MKRYLIAHDIGTSGDKAALMTLEGEILRSHSEAYPFAQPAPGHAEQDPGDWWRAFCLCNRAILQGLDPREVAGICLTGQMMCCLPVDGQGAPLCPAIIWADARAQAEASTIAEAVGRERYYSITGMRVSANYGLPKMMWIKNHRPDVYEKARAFLSPKDYVNFLLTGRFATDHENAAFLHCYDWLRQAWSAELLGAAGIGEDKLPELLEEGSLIGSVSPCSARECGLAAGTPVVMGPGDGGAATLGSAVLAPGEAYASIGTSSWVCVVSGNRRLDPLQRTAKINYRDTVRDSGTMQAGGYGRSWMEKLLFSSVRADSSGASIHQQADEAAARVPTGAGGVLFLPYLMGERSPVWDPLASASFIGMTAGTTRAHLCRSVLEGVAMHLCWILDCIAETNGLRPDSIKLVGGGAKSNVWSEIFADVFDLPVHLVARPDQAGALGTAVTAGVGLGIYSDYSAIREFQPIVHTIEPRPANAALYHELKPVLADAYAALQNVNHRLRAISRL